MRLSALKEYAKAHKDIDDDDLFDVYGPTVPRMILKLIAVAEAAKEITKTEAYSRWDRQDLLLEQIYDLNDRLKDLERET